MENFREAETYDRTSANQREDGMNLISLLPIQMGNRILDLGCGTGYLSKVLASEIGPNGKVCMQIIAYAQSIPTYVSCKECITFCKSDELLLEPFSLSHA